MKEEQNSQEWWPGEERWKEASYEVGTECAKTRVSEDLAVQIPWRSRVWLIRNAAFREVLREEMKGRDTY